MTAVTNVDPGTAGEASGVSEEIRTMRGEPDFVRKSGQSMADYGHLMSEVGAQLRTIKDTEVSEWAITGKAAETLRSSIGDAADMIALASALYLPIGQALSHYGSMTQYYQDELNPLAVTCQELWQKVEELRADYADSSAPDKDDDDYAEKKDERDQLESDLEEAREAWATSATSWNNLYVGWRAVYLQAVGCLSDPSLEAIRKGKDLPDAPPLDLYPNGDPDPDDINQAGAGDCYLLSVLAGIANGDPQKIKDMITVNPDGTYTVHFADGDITVGGDQIPNDGQADWVRIIEGAYEIHEGGYEEFNNGGRPESVMEDIYGKGADQKDNDGGFWDFVSGGNDIADSYDDIKKALAEGRPVVADALYGDLGFGDEKKGGGHALTVLDAYEKDGVEMVEIRNPWGSNGDHVDDIVKAGGVLHSPDDGYFTMSMKDFAKAFTYVEIANK